MRENESVCAKSGKRGFHSRNQARAAHRSNGKRVRVYICPECHHWHVTSQARPDIVRKPRNRLPEAEGWS